MGTKGTMGTKVTMGTKGTMGTRELRAMEPWNQKTMKPVKRDPN